MKDKINIYSNMKVAGPPNGAHQTGWQGQLMGMVPRSGQGLTLPTIDTIVGACEATTTATVGTCDIIVPQAGMFILRATATDARNNTVRSSTNIYGTERSPTVSTAWAADDRHGIPLEANKKEFEIGETAKTQMHRILLVEREFYFALTAESVLTSVFFTSMRLR